MQKTDGMQLIVEMKNPKKEYRVYQGMRDDFPDSLGVLSLKDPVTG